MKSLPKLPSVLEFEFSVDQLATNDDSVRQSAPGEWSMGGGPQHQFQHWQLRGARELSGGMWPKWPRMDCQRWWSSGGCGTYWHIKSLQLTRCLC